MRGLKGCSKNDENRDEKREMSISVRGIEMCRPAINIRLEQGANFSLHFDSELRELIRVLCSESGREEGEGGLLTAVFSWGRI